MDELMQYIEALERKAKEDMDGYLQTSDYVKAERSRGEYYAYHRCVEAIKELEKGEKK